MTPEDQVHSSISVQLYKKISENILTDLEGFASRVSSTNCDLTKRILGEELVDLCVAFDRSSWLLDDIRKLGIDTNKVSNDIEVIKGFSGTIFRFEKNDLKAISDLLRSKTNYVQAIKMFREKAIGHHRPSLKESKLTCDEFPFHYLSF